MEHIYFCFSLIYIKLSDLRSRVTYVNKELLYEEKTSGYWTNSTSPYWNRQYLRINKNYTVKNISTARETIQPRFLKEKLVLWETLTESNLHYLSLILGSITYSKYLLSCNSLASFKSLFCVWKSLWSWILNNN